VKPVREAAVGASLPPNLLPPFNPTGNPPIAFVFVDACNTGIGPEFLPAFCYPEKNFYSDGAIEDQAQMGWLWRVENDVLDDVAQVFWHHCSAGRVLEYCRAKAQDKYFEQAGYEPGGPQVLRLYGDANTRLKDVYTGDDSYVPAIGANRRWFRVLSQGY
jgi:hypothetical protein